MVPTVWVEGRTDITFYRPISAGIMCRFEPCGGRENAWDLVLNLRKNNHPYAVVIDGDYEILRRSRAPHRFVIILPRYSYENLLWEPGAINEICCRHAECGDQKDLVSVELKSTVRMIEERLLRTIILDVAARKSPDSPRVLPRNVEPILERQDDTALDREKIARLVKSALPDIDRKEVLRASQKVGDFLAVRSITHLLKGHILFGLLRRVIINCAARESGRRRDIAKDALAHMLSDAVWKCCKSGDHQRLRRGFRSKLRAVSLSFHAAKGRGA